jgi:hypothetical protein
MIIQHTAPIRIRPEYELYRVILDYEALQDGFLDRIEDLNTTLEQIDMAGDFTKGNVQKLLTKDGGKPGPDRLHSLKRTFGWESLGKMLKGTGLALVLVVDDERFAPTKALLAKRKRPVHPNGSMRRPAWLITKEASQNMQQLRNQKLSPRQRRLIAKKAARTRWQKQRRSVCAVAAPIVAAAP